MMTSDGVVVTAGSTGVVHGVVVIYTRVVQGVVVQTGTRVVVQGVVVQLCTGVVVQLVGVVQLDVVTQPSVAGVVVAYSNGRYSVPWPGDLASIVGMDMGTQSRTQLRTRQHATAEERRMGCTDAWKMRTRRRTR